MGIHQRNAHVIGLIDVGAPGFTEQFQVCGSVVAVVLVRYAIRRNVVWQVAFPKKTTPRLVGAVVVWQPCDAWIGFNQVEFLWPDMIGI